MTHHVTIVFTYRLLPYHQGVLMGMDLNAFERPEGANFDPSDPGASAPPPPTPSAPSSSTPSASAPKTTPPPPPKKEEPEPMEVDEDASAKAEAESLKKKGNETYKARKFDEAIELYEKAWETWPKDISYLTNLAGELIRSKCFFFFCFFFFNYQQKGTSTI